MTATLPDLNTALLSDALRYLARGWSIIPIGADKKPTVKWKRYGSERADESTLRGWFAKQGITGIAVIFGAVSGGLASRDFDSEDAYREWAVEHPELAMILPTVKTSRGYHVYFRAEEERFAKYDNGEYRGDRGHYSILPPSIHSSGVLYEWTSEPPKGDFPVINPVNDGLASEECNREHREHREHREMASGISVDSVLSVAWTDDLSGTLPSAEGQRNNCIFLLARTLKARPELTDATSQQLDPILREWHRRALPYITTKAYGESKVDFDYAWNKVKFPLGTSPVEEQMKKANAMNPPVSVEDNDIDIPGARRLATLCSLLQENAGGGVFFLSSRKAADVLGEDDHTSAWRWLKLLQLYGLLIQVEPGTKVKAARYRWVGGPARAK